MRKVPKTKEQRDYRGFPPKVGDMYMLRSGSSPYLYYGPKWRSLQKDDILLVTKECEPDRWGQRWETAVLRGDTIVGEITLSDSTLRSKQVFKLVNNLKRGRTKHARQVASVEPDPVS